MKEGFPETLGRLIALIVWRVVHDLSWLIDQAAERMM